MNVTSISGLGIRPTRQILEALEGLALVELEHGGDMCAIAYRAVHLCEYDPPPVYAFDELWHILVDLYDRRAKASDMGPSADDRDDGGPVDFDALIADTLLALCGKPRTWRQR